MSRTWPGCPSSHDREVARDVAPDLDELAGGPPAVRRGDLATGFGGFRRRLRPGQPGRGGDRRRIAARRARDASTTSRGSRRAVVIRPRRARLRQADATIAADASSSRAPASRRAREAPRRSRQRARDLRASEDGLRRAGVGERDPGPATGEPPRSPGRRRVGDRTAPRGSPRSRAGQASRAESLRSASGSSAGAALPRRRTG